MSLQKLIFTVCMFLCSYAIKAEVAVFNHLEQFKQLSSKNVKTIIQDSTGIMWFGTTNGLFSFDGYDLSKSVINDNEYDFKVNKLFLDSKNNLWMCLNNHGLYKYNNGSWDKFNLSLENNKSISVYDIKEVSSSQLYLATDQGLKYISSSNDSHSIIQQSLKYFATKPISSLDLNDNYLVLATDDGFSVYNRKDDNLSQYRLDNINTRIRDLHISSDEKLWIASNNGLVNFDLIDREFIVSPLSQTNSRIFDISEHNNNIWISTIGEGVYKINNKNSSLTNFSHNKNLQNSLSENNISSTYVSNDGVLWVGTFSKGVNFTSLDSLNFGYTNNSQGQIDCAESNAIYAGMLDEENTMWIAAINGFIKYNKNQCQVINFQNLDESPTDIISMLDRGNEIWLLGVTSIYVFNKTTQSLHRAYDFDAPKNVSFITDLDNKDRLLFGTYTGLFEYDIANNSTEKLKFKNSITDPILFNGFNKNIDGNFIFATSIGFVTINTEKQLEPLDSINSQLNDKHITSVNEINNTYYFGIKNKGLYKVNDNEKPEPIYQSEISINGIVDYENQLWMATNHGLLKHDINENFTHLFSWNDGIYNDYFYASASDKNDSTLLFGGINGLIHFNPDDISLAEFTAQIVILDLSLMNNKVQVNQKQDSGFLLTQPINEMHEIELSYKDYIVGFEYAALDYADSNRNQYAYRLVGFKDEWTFVDAGNRQATYTNLSPGDYTFQVKASNKDGKWSEKHKSLKIIIHPAPWFSPLAFFAYFVIVVFSIWAFIRYKTIASRKRAQQLEVTVKERTHEVNLQKKMVESLLDHKNEVFANITHEFKTPLALIMGPVDQLAEDNRFSDQSDKLNMIQRNAKRLMLMVGQILKLSQAEVDKEIIRESQAVQPTLTMLFESFKPLANDKNIEINIKNDFQANVYATADCLEIVIGNLISNALKFTNSGGQVSISSELKENQVLISVKDNGTGIESKDLDKVFKRFVRLDTHKSIQGTGIGLSVVKEITEANNGHVFVNSQWGKGSEFIVSFPMSDIQATEDMSQVMVDQLVGNTENELSIEQKAPIVNVQEKHKITVLIIEDNLDMQAHIGNVLKNRFNCLFADRGRDGIALALNEVPDIIICDVMMPEMDGYQVTRILRHDGRTSHIPIILLTALNTKESRIKGWRENIDIYVTKPFDATELNVQLDNILMIRKMLQSKTNQAIKSNDSLDSLELSDQDMKFIEKFKDVIATYYTNEYFQKADLAAKMAVSERQLQRKMKALINENPMDMLRDYRLEQAAIKLKQGHQVNICSDACGFSSVSYFGTCFKKKYGVTPKKYQQMK